MSDSSDAAGEPHASRNPYDRIAHLYDIDMARNMAFDDVGFYAKAVRDARGRVLELGCGNGRILLSLRAQGIDVWGVDRSLAMLKSLRAKAAAQNLADPVFQMDVRALGFCAGSFAAVLCPYSLVTYMTAVDDAPRMLGEIRRVLQPGGMLGIDAFVPRAATYSDEFRIDYSRPFETGTLTRSKRVRPLSPGVNRIERRYDIELVHPSTRERIETVEDIRPFTPEALGDIVTRAGFGDLQRTWDYSSRTPTPDAQFFTLFARTPLHSA